jgi:tetratricopeptide (TPR) repeat protein
VSVAALCAEAKNLVMSARHKALTAGESDRLFTEAIGKLRAALDATNGSHETLAQYGAALLSWARSDLNNGVSRDRLEESSRSLAIALEKCPTDETSLFNRGLCICLIAAAHAPADGQNLYAEACRMYDNLLALNPSSRVGAFNCGLAYVSRARLREAENPASEDVVAFYRQAEDRFRKTLELQPADTKAKAYLEECQSALRTKSSSRLP